MYVYKKRSHTRRHAQTHMGWRRLVGALKLLVSFAKEPCKRDYILQKRPMILRSILIVATPYEKKLTLFFFSPFYPFVTACTHSSLYDILLLVHTLSYVTFYYIPFTKHYTTYNDYIYFT